MIETIIAMIVGYLFGSITTAIITCKLLNLPDPRTFGSGNPGATNVLRHGGKKAAIITLIGDILKAVIPLLIARWIGLDTLTLAAMALAVFIGHLYPLFFKFQGGKGVATAFGCLISLSLPVGLCILAVWLSVAFLCRYSSVAAICTAITAPFFTYFFTNNTYTIMVCIMSVLLIFRHRSNIQSLIEGKENKIGVKE